MPMKPLPSTRSAPDGQSREEGDKEATARTGSKAFSSILELKQSERMGIASYSRKHCHSTHPTSCKLLHSWFEAFGVCGAWCSGPKASFSRQ